MALVVQKYGGTSVGSLERIRIVAQHIKETSEKGNKVVAIVSAMAGETDKLIKMAKELSERPSEREMDLLLSSGERISSALVAIRLNAIGAKAVAMTGRQCGIVTDEVHTKARIKAIDAENIMKHLNNGEIVIVAGFQGISQTTGDVTTLGRGGSDTTAVAIAAALKADVCEIYTDVDGIFTADPRIVKNARKLDKISYSEMMELASLGAKVLQIRSVEFGMKYEVPIMVLSSFTFNPGTLVTKEDKDMEKIVVSGIAQDKNQARLKINKVEDKPGVAAKIFDKIAANNINVDMIVQNVSDDGKTTDISFTVQRDEADKAFDVLKRLADELKAGEVSINKDVAKVSVVGVGMRSHPGVAAKMFETLARENINIRAISTSEIKISCLIDEKYTELAVRSLHEAFGLDKE
ncbi:aspartate kinase [Hippea maritima]|uniref:Aspartokinase n=1 Tax=Hippea maritima (strain ATCC 700847 / DSM 10411 / MH2) TaxID=760142 RepID=F2LWN7_HIPMA|nr:aspartate kinase [Hippea maritima]AEA33015.1 aspartate kinase [Hippea maritima DSM 10411]